MQKIDYVPKWSPQVWEQKPGYLKSILLTEEYFITS